MLGSATMGPNRPGRGSHVGTASFMVDEAVRGRGIGRRLGEHVVRWHRDAGLPRHPVQRRGRDQLRRCSPLAEPRLRDRRHGAGCVPLAGTRVRGPARDVPAASVTGCLTSLRHHLLTHVMRRFFHTAAVTDVDAKAAELAARNRREKTAAAVPLRQGLAGDDPRHRLPGVRPDPAGRLASAAPSCTCTAARSPLRRTRTSGGSRPGWPARWTPAWCSRRTRSPPTTPGATPTSRWSGCSGTSPPRVRWCWPATPPAAGSRSPSRWASATPAARSRSHLVLLSPWVDLTTSAPGTVEAGARDPWLNVENVPVYAGYWAGSADDLARPEVSPGLADVTGLPPTLMMCGTRDLLFPACRELADRAAMRGWDCTFVVERGLMHVYPLLPIPEAKRGVPAGRRLPDLSRYVGSVRPQVLRGQHQLLGRDRGSTAHRAPGRSTGPVAPRAARSAAPARAARPAG